MPRIPEKVTPNAITVARIMLIPVFVAALLTGIDSDLGAIFAFVVFAVAALTDGLDGYLARSRNRITTMGIFLDPLADKLLVTAALVTLVQLEKIAAWVVLIIISREFAVTGLRLLAASNGDVISANKLGKAKTVSQILLILALILELTPNSAPDGVVIGLTVIAVFFTLASGAEYFWEGREHLREPDAVSVEATEAAPIE